MASITYDARSFQIDGRRIWLVSGAIQYARLPREAWAHRIHLAKLAGLNTIETPVVWAEHEPRPGSFDFEGDRDLRHFVELCGRAGMYVILRPGPFVGSSFDLGGLPSWLPGAAEGIKLRGASAPLLEACSRYLTAVAEQVRDLQVTSSGTGGPIILVQNESHWTCGSEVEANGYLGELHRYLRESGMTVPTINSNNLWQGMESEVAAWSGSEQMLATTRQLSEVKPDQPRLVIDFSVTAQSVLGEAAGSAPEPMAIQRRLAEILSGGGQFNIDPICGGSNFGFIGGRLANEPEAFATQSADRYAPVGESGMPGASFHAVRRVATFARSFARVFSHLDPDHRPVGLDPTEAGTGKQGPGLSIVHTSGSQGGVVFIFGADPGIGGSGGPRRGSVLLPNGSTLPFDLGEQAVAWITFDAHLHGRAHLDHSSLCVLGHVGKALVVYGPTGSAGEISINGSRLEVVPPAGKEPDIISHEGVTVVVCNERQADEVLLLDETVLVGVSGVEPDGTPIAASGRKVTRIDEQGTAELVEHATQKRAPRTPTFGSWETADSSEHLLGESARYARIDGPSDLTSLGSPYGYGWYRLTLKASSAKKVKVMSPGSGDRLGAFVDGEPIGVLGLGAGASVEMTIPLRKGERSLVLLAENMGRYSTGSGLGESKGLTEHLWEVAPFKVAKPEVVIGEPIEPLKHRSPLWEVRDGDVTWPERLTWTFTHRKKSPVIMSIESLPDAAVLLINGEFARFCDRNWTEQILLDELNRGNNTIELAFLAADEEHLEQLIKQSEKCITFHEGTSCLSEKSEFSFAKWERPGPAAFEPMPKGKAKQATEGTPTWWRSSFAITQTHTPLRLEFDGLTKGQVYLNGRHLGRYFVATASGERVPPQGAVYLPASWLREQEPNEVVIFDEHGGSPSKCKLAYDTSGKPVIA